jgi:hypothetical protein
MIASRAKTPRRPQPRYGASLQPGAWLRWQEMIWEIVSTPDEGDHSTTVDLRALDTGERTRVETRDLLLGEHASSVIFAPTRDALRAKLAQDTPPPYRASAGAVAPGLLRRADEMIANVERVRRAVREREAQARLRGDRFKRTPAVRQAVADITRTTGRYSVATYYDHAARVDRCNGDRARLAESLHRSTHHTTRFSDTTIAFVDAYLLRYYARTPPISQTSFYDEILQPELKRLHGLWVDPNKCPHGLPQDLIEELLNRKIPIAAILQNPEKAALLSPVELPSWSWMNQYVRYVAGLPDRGKALITARYGSERWEREHLVFDHFVQRAATPLQYVFADHTLLNVFAVDEASRSKPIRLWLTLLIDAYSRSVLGFALLHEEPSIDSIQTALLQAIWPKRLPEGWATADRPWACYGVPVQLFLDNALAHHSHSLENLARAIGCDGQYNTIDLMLRPPYRGRYGAIIERYFRTLKARLRARVAGALQSSRPRDVSTALRQACLLYEDVYDAILQEIVAYQHHPHTELGNMTPHEKWIEGLAYGPPLVPPLTDDLARNFWRMEPTTRVISHQGICAFGMHYWSTALNAAPACDKDGVRIRYTFHYAIDNIACLALFRDGGWVGDVGAQELRRPDGSYRTVSVAAREMARRLAKERDGTTRNWLSEQDRADALTARRRAEQSVAQRAHAQTRTGVGVPAPVKGGAPVGKPGTDPYTASLSSFAQEDGSARG